MRQSLERHNGSAKLIAEHFKYTNAEDRLGVFWGVFMLAHVPLALAMHRSPQFATAHALMILAVGLYFALSSRHPERVIWLTAYIVGAEVLWRMCKASTPWETGKYAVSVILLIHGLRMVRHHRFWPIFYIVLLLPATFYTLFDLDWLTGSRMVSFNMSGPLCIAACVWYFSGVTVSKADFCRTLLVTIAPLLGITAITLFTTYTTTNLAFNTESNFATSGGFGPNQVSAILSLGFLMVFFLFFTLNKKNRILTASVAPLLPLFLIQSAMTFSRTGVYIGLAAAIASSLFLMRSGRARLGLVVGGIVFFALTYNVVFPRLETFTDGAFSARYTEASTTNRYEIFMSELETFVEHPLGVGVGMAREYRQAFSDFASHSEISRLLAEHGIFGLGALVLLIVGMFRNWRSKLSVLEQAVTVAFMVWFTGFILASGMRLSAPAVVLGLTFMTLRTNTLRPEEPGV